MRYRPNSIHQNSVNFYWQCYIGPIQFIKSQQLTYSFLSICQITISFSDPLSQKPRFQPRQRSSLVEKPGVENGSLCTAVLSESVWRSVSKLTYFVPLTAVVTEMEAAGCETVGGAPMTIRVK